MQMECKVPWGWQHVHDRHGGGDVAHHPEGEGGLWHKHGEGEHDAEEGEGVEGENHLAEEEEEEDEVELLPPRNLGRKKEKKRE